ncbi:porin family protein [Chitinophaga nivalis]|uniref:PorT family protein n=1 Tax=Chitinophaga nivalis TaxID=2991709 RepID=A0ABT3IQE9_9BACT|nr:porin family protein [Chitinophaga nivalis]MCW3464147.1 PorT family protein [Chitinophaga nivalis]MCW3486163.1 PorT family protein [Chitinophaga nivalis]
MKYIITCSLCLLLHITVRAQQSNLSFGIKAGINQAGLTGGMIDSLSTGGATSKQTGIQIGVSLNHQFSKYCWLKQELFYSLRRVQLQLADDTHPAYNSPFRRQSIDLFPASPTFHYKGFQVFAGPFISMLLTASLQRRDDNGNTYTDKSLYGTATADNKYSHKFDAGLAAGLEYEFPLGINIGVRYMRGFVPIIENAAAQQQWQIFNQTAAFTVGYSF